MSADLLRRAAKVLRDHALAAEGDLAALFDELAGDQADVDTWEAAMSHILDHELGNYCALLPPPVAVAMAELLDRVAPLAPYWAEPYAAPWVPVIEQATKLAAAILRDDT